MTKGSPAWRLWTWRYTHLPRWNENCACMLGQSRPSMWAGRLETGTQPWDLTPGWSAPLSPRGPVLAAGRGNPHPGRNAVGVAATGAPEARSLKGSIEGEGRLWWVTDIVDLDIVFIFELKWTFVLNMKKSFCWGIKITLTFITQTYSQHTLLFTVF